MSNNVVLFDMDGTLTLPRQKFSERILSSSLIELSRVADIGIVTGSDSDYLFEQMKSMINDQIVRYALHLLPCNGTKWFLPPEFPSHSHSQIHGVNMVEFVGKEKYRKLMEILLQLQSEATGYDIPLTGNFISARGSMINWCPIGRSAGEKERKSFKNFDKQFKFRNQYFMKLRLLLDSNDMQDIVVKLGGDTSFDIYPAGWDKTYALRHFSGKNVWFVGDRAQGPKGNDYEIYKSLEPRSFKTEGPEQTKEIISIIIETIRGS